MPENALAVQDRTLYAISDDLTAWWESREMVAAQLAEPTEDAERAALTANLAEIDGHLDSLGAELAAKTDNIAGVLRRMRTEQERLATEQDRIHGRLKTFERAEEWLRAYVLKVMRQRGLKHLKTESNTLFIRPSDSVAVEDPQLVPADYKNVTVKMPAWLWRCLVELAEPAEHHIREGIKTVRAAENVSLSAIKKAIKSGVDVPGADLDFNDNLVLR